MPTSVKNPQANTILERSHAVFTIMLFTAEINLADSVKPSNINVFLSDSGMGEHAGWLRDGATYDNAAYHQSGAAENSYTYCKRGAADNVATYLCGSEAKDNAAFAMVARPKTTPRIRKNAEYSCNLEKKLANKKLWYYGWGKLNNIIM
jgi:hypothetical protein